MRNLQEKIQSTVVYAKGRLKSASQYMQARKGLSETVEKLLWVLAAIAIVGGIVAAITLALNNEILPSIISKIKAGF